MGPLPQMPDNIIVALMLLPFVPDQSTMCNACAHRDDIAEEAFSDRILIETRIDGSQIQHMFSTTISTATKSNID